MPWSPPPGIVTLPPNGSERDPSSPTSGEVSLCPPRFSLRQSVFYSALFCMFRALSNQLVEKQKSPTIRSGFRTKMRLVSGETATYPDGDNIPSAIEVE